MLYEKQMLICISCHNYDYWRLIGQKELVKIAVEIEISVFMAILSCF